MILQHPHNFIFDIRSSFRQYWKSQLLFLNKPIKKKDTKITKINEEKMIWLLKQNTDLKINFLENKKLKLFLYLYHLLMGVCPMDSEMRELRTKNRKLQQMMNENLKDLAIYYFSEKVRKKIGTMQLRYMLTHNILEDIDQVVAFSKLTASQFQKAASLSLFDKSENLEEDVSNSCLIIQNQIRESKEAFNLQSHQIKGSFMNNLNDNQSLVEQMNIIYGKDVDKEQYIQNLRLFLKWTHTFNEHLEGGFLKPIFKAFCRAVYQIDRSDFQTMIDQICVFVQYLVKIVTEVYRLKELNASKSGGLFKNENIFNFIMSFLFKKTKLKLFLLSVIRQIQKLRIAALKQKLNTYCNQSPEYFGISKEFVLGPYSYAKTVKLVEQLCSQKTTPISKLKKIVGISKSLMAELYEGYKGKDAPPLDPDNLTAIIIYLIVRNNNEAILEELKIVETLTTTNCLNCISGFYLKTFTGAIQVILSLH